MSLIGNRLNGSIPKELGNISTLQTLTVEDNMMLGIIQEELGNLSSIEKFRLGGNNFSGKIPDFIRQWRSLVSFVGTWELDKSCT
ncbi:putative non-specific serine/threonine protein kinase [Helianthus debilis subsp. tardiflorus]